MEKNRKEKNMELFLVRHGETIWNQEGRYYGYSDIPLSEKGISQARTLHTFFQDITFDKVIVSPLKRAMDTAKELTTLPFVTDHRLMEQNFGKFEGKTYRELMEEFPEELTCWNKDHQEYCLPEGESFRMVRERVDSFLQDLWEEEGRVLLVAHKGTFGHLLASMLHMPLSGYWNFVFEQGTYSKVDLEDGFAIIRTLNQTPKNKD